MKSYSSIKKPIIAICALACSALLSSCGSNECTPVAPSSSDATPAVDKNANITSVYGTYTRFLGYEDLKDAFTTKITSHGTDDSNYFENDTLALFNSTVARHENNSYQWKEGDRYVYTRHLQITTIGLSFWQQYIGHYTWEKGTRNITLSFPEVFSYYYFFGDGSGSLFTDYGAAHVVVDTSEEAFASGKVRLDSYGTYVFKEEETGIAADPDHHASGYYSFNYDHADYHNGATEIGPMDLVLDLNTMTHAFPNLDE